MHFRDTVTNVGRGASPRTGFLPQPSWYSPDVHQHVETSAAGAVPALSYNVDAPVLQRDLVVNTGRGYLQGLDDGSVERVNDSDSSTARNCRLSLPPNQQHRAAGVLHRARYRWAFCRMGDKRGVHPQNSEHIDRRFTLAPLCETYSSPRVESISHAVNTDWALASSPPVRATYEAPGVHIHSPDFISHTIRDVQAATSFISYGP